MTREDKIRLIAYQIWEKEGCTHGHDADNWLKAEAFWVKKQRDMRTYVTIAALVLLSALLLDFFLVNQSHLATLLSVGVLTILILSYLWVNPIKTAGNWLIDTLGFEEIISVPYIIGICGSILLAFYLLSIKIIPNELQFSIVPIALMLGAFVIAAANSPKITIEQRSKLIRIAQKLMIATLAFIFFTVFWFFTTLGYDIDPNTLGTEWAKSFCFWFAAVLFLVATGTFVIGIIELVMSLKNLRQA